MKIAIVDDSQPDRKILQDFIFHYCSEHQIAVSLLEFESGESLLVQREQEKLDLIFLDIYMDGIDGIETAKRIREQGQESLLVFVTTSSQHAVESYRVRAFDYIVKPYDYQQFEEMMNLCCQVLARNSRYIQVKEGRTLVRILLKDIFYTDYYNHYIQIHTKKRVIKTYMSFQDFSSLLKEYSQFMCCYRNCLINMDEVASVEERDFLMKNGERVPIARAKRYEIRQQYANYMFDKLDFDD